MEDEPMCPYCGSKKIERIDWGFADWECQTCRNNFKSPYYQSKEPLSEHKPSDEKHSDPFVVFLGYFMKVLLIVCIVVAIAFFAIRLYQIFILPFL